MRLHLECIDHPDPEKHYQPERIQIDGKALTGRIVIDNHQFGQCQFEGCTFLYSGGPFGFFECDLKGGCRLVLTGCARRTSECIQAFEPYLRLITPY